MRTSIGKRLYLKPRNRTRSRVPIRVLIRTNIVDARALWDTGASCFVVSDRLVSGSKEVVKRDRTTIIHDYAGRAGAGGQLYTKPLSFFLAGKRFKEPMEIASLHKRLGYDIIIPNWWIEESGLILGCQNGVYEVSSPGATEPPLRQTPGPIRTGK